jgi:hypothetical protein
VSTVIEHAGTSRRYRPTDYGRAVAVLFTTTHGRVLAPGLVQLDPNLPDDVAARSSLAQAPKHRPGRSCCPFCGSTCVGKSNQGGRTGQTYRKPKRLHPIGQICLLFRSALQGVEGRCT